MISAFRVTFTGSKGFFCSVFGRCSLSLSVSVNSHHPGGVVMNRGHRPTSGCCGGYGEGEISNRASWKIWIAVQGVLL